MRTAVYRNLDKPFQILGFNILEITILCGTLVGGGELLELFSGHRIWSVFSTAVLALSMFWFRRSLGEAFFRKLIRFIKLPRELNPQLLIQGKQDDPQTV